jgi:hypothetical protein
MSSIPPLIVACTQHAAQRMLDATLAKLNGMQWKLCGIEKKYRHVGSQRYGPNKLGEHRDDACGRQRERA